MSIVTNVYHKIITQHVNVAQCASNFNATPPICPLINLSQLQQLSTHQYFNYTIVHIRNVLKTSNMIQITYKYAVSLIFRLQFKVSYDENISGSRYKQNT